MDGPRVLVVEGQDPVASRLEHLVTSVFEAAVVIRAGTVAEALDLADGPRRLDVAVVAAELPDGSGMRVAQQALSNPDPPAIVLLVEHEDAALWRDAGRAGVGAILPRDGLTAQRLRGGLDLARERSLADRVMRLVADAATTLDASQHMDQEISALLGDLLITTRASGVRLSVGLLASRPRRWTRGEVEAEGPTFSVSGRTAGASALLELFDGDRNWTTARPALIALCEVVTAALVRRQSLEQVRASEARLRDLAENVPEPIVSVDADGRIAAANRRFCQAGGQGEVVGQLLTVVARPRSLGALAARAVEESRLTGSPVALGDHPVEVPDVGERWHEAKATPDPSGTVHVVLPDTTERVFSERRLTELALTDHLTGLANRRLAIDRLQHALNQVGRSQQQLVVSMCDIDHFKSTNDLFGHAAGDSILVALADRLRSAIRSSDTAARLGGDEFLIISEGIDTPEAADVVIRRLHDRLCGPVEAGGEELQLSVSLGYVVVSDAGRTADDILRQADLALYSAKAGGRGRCAAYGVQAASATDHEWAERLERAWRNGRFVLRWAPVAALDGRILACRAVLSWIDDDGVERDPDELITVLSNGRLLGPVRHSLIRKALRQRSDWQRDGLIDEHFRVHVRVFARQLADIDLTQDLLGELRDTGTPPSSLVLDVEDQALMAGPGGLTRLEQLTDAGVRLYLDRFGADAVPLERLTWTALAGIRLDPAVVHDVWRDPRRAGVADCLLELGARAGLDLVVDGIDHPEQLEWLSGKPILGVAGPLVGGALKVDEMQDRLTSRSPLERRGSFRLT